MEEVLKLTVLSGFETKIYFILCTSMIVLVKEDNCPTEFHFVGLVLTPFPLINMLLTFLCSSDTEITFHIIIYLQIVHSTCK